MNNNISVIGGADGPTSLFLAGRIGINWIKIFGLIIAVLLLVICAILIMICILGLIGLIGCSIPKHLTLDKVVELSAKGEELIRADFKQYKGYECGSGYYIKCYDIDKDFELLVGELGAVGSPMYIRLRTKSNIENYIDIRTGDVKSFIANNS